MSEITTTQVLRSLASLQCAVSQTMLALTEEDESSGPSTSSAARPFYWDGPFEDEGGIVDSDCAIDFFGGPPELGELIARLGRSARYFDAIWREILIRRELSLPTENP